VNVHTYVLAISAIVCVIFANLVTRYRSLSCRSIGHISAIRLQKATSIFLGQFNTVTVTTPICARSRKEHCVPRKTVSVGGNVTTSKHGLAAVSLPNVKLLFKTPAFRVSRLIAPFCRSQSAFAK